MIELIMMGMLMKEPWKMVIYKPSSENPVNFQGFLIILFFLSVLKKLGNDSRDSTDLSVNSERLDGGATGAFLLVKCYFIN